MCGIIGLLLANENEHVNQLLFDGLTVLQHRGQDAAGIVTSERTKTIMIIEDDDKVYDDDDDDSDSGEQQEQDNNNHDGNNHKHSSSSNNMNKKKTMKKKKISYISRLHLRKDNGLVRDVFHTHHMKELVGHCGIGHCRYPTAGNRNAATYAEAQPLYTNYPYGICVAHNGNLTNADELNQQLRTVARRHVNTDSDSELLLNVFAEALATVTTTTTNTTSTTNTNATNDYHSNGTQQTNGHSHLRHHGNNGNSSSSSNHDKNDVDVDVDDDLDMARAIFDAMSIVMKQCRGGYAGLFLINGFGLVGFRDPYGIRPLVFGCRQSSTSTGTTTSASSTADHENNNTTTNNHNNNNNKDNIMKKQPLDYVICSESVAIDTLQGFQLIRDVKAGEAIYIDMNGNCHTKVVYDPTKSPPIVSSSTTTLSTTQQQQQQQLDQHKLDHRPAPCIFEYVYFARPDSIMDGISVYETRLRMGEKLARKILRLYPQHDIDVVIPIPDTSRTAALQAAYILNRPFREGFIKNRYIARTFIMPGQETRKKSVRLKLNTIKSEFMDRNVLLVDDSIVRGTTADEIIQMSRDAGARCVYFCSAAPPIRYPNIYGIDIPTRSELIAYQRTELEIAQRIGCDWIIYQDLDDLEDCIREEAYKTMRYQRRHHHQKQNNKNNNNNSKKDEDKEQHDVDDVDVDDVVANMRFDTSCFSGTYVTGEKIDDEYFEKLHRRRSATTTQLSQKQRNQQHSIINLVGGSQSTATTTTTNGDSSIGRLSNTNDGNTTTTTIITTSIRQQQQGGSPPQKLDDDPKQQHDASATTTTTTITAIPQPSSNGGSRIPTSSSSSSSSRHNNNHNGNHSTTGGGGGCESVSNDTRVRGSMDSSGDDACESLPSH